MTDVIGLVHVRIQLSESSTSCIDLMLSGDAMMVELVAEVENLEGPEGLLECLGDSFWWAWQFYAIDAVGQVYVDEECHGSGRIRERFFSGPGKRFN